MVKLSAFEIRTLNRYTYHPLNQRMCSKCLVVYQGIPENFHIKKYYLDKTPGYNVWCKECFNTHNQERTARYRADPAKFIKARLSGFKCRASELGVPYNLSAEALIAQWEQQKGQCFYTAQPIAFNNIRQAGKAPHYMMASLDRMDPTQGYVIGNVVWCSYVINRMKNDLTYDEFLKMCELILNVRRQND